MLDQILEAIQTAIGDREDAFTPLHEPDFAGNEWPYVKECFDADMRRPSAHTPSMGRRPNWP
jgi:hypothetical protein